MHVAEMVTEAGGTWITPTIIIGQEVGLGFDPEWIKARLAVCAGRREPTASEAGVPNVKNGGD